MAASTQADLLGNRYGHLAYRRRVLVPSTASTANYNVSPRESGAIFRVANFAAATRVQFALPKISSLGLGLTYEFLLTSRGDGSASRAGDTHNVSTRVDCRCDSNVQRRGGPSQKELVGQS